MPPKNDSPVPAIKHSEDGRFTHYGFEEDGVFHPIFVERASEYQERVLAAKESSEGSEG